MTEIDVRKYLVDNLFIDDRVQENFGDINQFMKGINHMLTVHSPRESKVKLFNIPTVFNKTPYHDAIRLLCMKYGDNLVIDHAMESPVRKYIERCAEGLGSKTAKDPVWVALTLSNLLKNKVGKQNLLRSEFQFAENKFLKEVQVQSVDLRFSEDMLGIPLDKDIQKMDVNSSTPYLEGTTIRNAVSKEFVTLYDYFGVDSKEDIGTEKSKSIIKLIEDTLKLFNTRALLGKNKVVTIDTLLVGKGVLDVDYLVSIPDYTLSTTVVYQIPKIIQGTDKSGIPKKLVISPDKLYTIMGENYDIDLTPLLLYCISRSLKTIDPHTLSTHRVSTLMRYLTHYNVTNYWMSSTVSLNVEALYKLKNMSVWGPLGVSSPSFEEHKHLYAKPDLVRDFVKGGSR